MKTYVACRVVGGIDSAVEGVGSDNYVIARDLVTTSGFFRRLRRREHMLSGAWNVYEVIGDNFYSRDNWYFIGTYYRGVEL